MPVGTTPVLPTTGPGTTTTFPPFPGGGGANIPIGGTGVGVFTTNVPVMGGMPSGFAPTAAALAAEGCSWYDIICLGKSQLIRLLLLIIGIICIIGAIYLYKPTQPIVKVITGAVKTGARALAEGAEAA